MVKDFFYSLSWLFKEVLFLPFDLLRSIQLDSWYIANIVSWSFILIGIAGAAYWLKKLKEFDDNDEENMTPSDFLKSSELEPDEIIENTEKDLVTKKLYKIINTLDQRSKDIIESRWLAEEKTTLEDLSKKYGISRERVRQIENESILKLKNNF